MEVEKIEKRLKEGNRGKRTEGRDVMTSHNDLLSLDFCQNRGLSNPKFLSEILLIHIKKGKFVVSLNF